jgi:propanediol dehydratase small subunit
VAGCERGGGDGAVSDLTEQSLAEMIDNITLANMPRMTIRPTHMTFTPEGLALRQTMAVERERRRLRNRRKREAKRL